MRLCRRRRARSAAGVCGLVIAKDAPTILIYGHFDVQPVDPLNEWSTPPFEPTIIGDTIYAASGASDMKSQTHAFIKALEALLKTGSLGNQCQSDCRG